MKAELTVSFLLLKLESCIALLTAAADKIFIVWWRESGNISQNLTDCCLALVLACVKRDKLKCLVSWRVKVKTHLGQVP